MRPRLSSGVTWSLLDQVMSSATNFVLLFAVVRYCSIEDVGGFSVAYAAYFILLLVARGLATEPLLIRYTADVPARWYVARRAAVGQAVTLGALFGAATAGTGLLVGSATGHALVALGLFLPGLLAQDAARYVYLGERRPAVAFWCDTSWLVVQIGLYAGASHVTNLDTSLYVGLWGAAGLVA